MKNIYSVKAFEERWYSRPMQQRSSGDISHDVNSDKNGKENEPVGRDRTFKKSWRQAAVLIALVERDGEVRIIFTERASGMRDHSGQISFPGGKIETLDKTAQKAALREANEEIGLIADNVNILGCQPTYYTGTGFEITPVVGIVKKPQSFITNESEVALIFDVPLSFLMDPANYVREKRCFNDKEYIFYAISYKDHYIWGATAGMIRLLFERLYQ